MQVRIYTEQVYRRFPKFFHSNEEPSTRSIKWDQVKQVLERAALPGNELEVYVVASH